MGFGLKFSPVIGQAILPHHKQTDVIRELAHKKKPFYSSTSKIIHMF